MSCCDAVMLVLDIDKGGDGGDGLRRKAGTGTGGIRMKGGGHEIRGEGISI
jgi:hypothetical protein